MDDIKCNAIVLFSRDYKEKDKQVTLFTPELGKINATLKSVKAANAKLKFAAQPFCFGEYILVEKMGSYIVSGCSVIDSFYDLTKDLNKYYAGSAILESIDAVVLPKQVESRLFIESLQALKNLCYTKTDSKIVLIKFFINIFAACGYKFSFTKCSACGANFTVRRFLNINTGEIVCSMCKNCDNIEITPEVHQCFRVIDNTEYDRLDSLKVHENVLFSALQVVKMLFSLKFNYELNTIKLLAE